MSPTLTVMLPGDSTLSLGDAVARAMNPFDDDLEVAPYETACFTIEDCPESDNHSQCCNGTLIVTSTVNPRGRWQDYDVLRIGEYSLRRGRPTEALLLPDEVWLDQSAVPHELRDAWKKMFRVIYRLYRKAGHVAVLVSYRD